MQFMVIAYDGTDEGALERRLAVRDAHLQEAREFFAQGKWLFAAGMLNDEGKMIGSLIVCDFPSRHELEKQWLEREPYLKGNVWKKVDIHRAHVASFPAPNITR